MLFSIILGPLGGETNFKNMRALLLRILVANDHAEQPKRRFRMHAYDMKRNVC